jgi:hypothetical protein
MYDASLRARHGNAGGTARFGSQAMKIDFDSTQSFVLIAELGGFGKAADRLQLI